VTPSPPTVTLYTIGHGARTMPELLALLAEAGVRTVVDVRRHPRSGRHPQFNEDRLRPALAAVGLAYHWAGRHLGGLRQARADSLHIALTDMGLRGYADHMQGEDFARAAAQLVGLARRSPTAILCAEREPAHCHRALLADYLTLHGVQVQHLLACGVQRAHLLHPALRRESLQPIYDRGVTPDLLGGRGNGN
jgi:uncharacterized protein (DUF488 family)